MRSSQWRDNPKQRDLTLCPYDQWRKDQDEAYHAARRSDVG
jgi:hypothetical protein